MVLWASTFVALKLAFRAYDPMVVIFGRMFIASLCALFVPFVFKAIKEVRKEDVKFILLMAFCEPCLYFIFEAKALVYTSASQAGIITAMMPLMTALGAWFFLKEQLSLKICIGFGVAAAGAVWLTLASPPTPHGPNPMLGNFLEFLAMACAAGYGLCCKRLTNRNYNPFFLAFTQCFMGAIFYFPLLFLPGTELPTVVGSGIPVRHCLSRGGGDGWRIRFIQLRGQPYPGQSGRGFCQSYSGDQPGSECRGIGRAVHRCSVYCLGRGTCRGDSHPGYPPAKEPPSGTTHHRKTIDFIEFLRRITDETLLSR